MSKQDYKTGDGHQIEFEEEWDGCDIVLNKNPPKFWCYDYSRDKFIQIKLNYYFSYHYDYGEHDFVRCINFDCGYDDDWTKAKVFASKQECMKSTAKNLKEEAEHYKKLMDKCNDKAAKILKCVE